MQFSTLRCLLVLTLPLCACRSNKSEAGADLHSGSMKATPPAGLHFTGRRPDGREIALSNRTKWTIQPAGASATLRWQTGEPLQLGSSGQPLWPTAITSIAGGATAFARPAGTF